MSGSEVASSSSGGSSEAPRTHRSRRPPRGDPPKQLPPVVKQGEFGSWSLTSTKSHILQSKCCCKENHKGNGDASSKCSFCSYEEGLKLPQLPDMVFPENGLQIVHKLGFGISFNALDALKQVNDHQDLIKVACADAWRDSRSESEHINEVIKPFDWTFTTDYKGSLIGESPMRVRDTDEKIDMEKLKEREKIGFYDDITLFEDELHDHGCAICSVKIRVMPSSFFVLLRFYLRVDDVLIRINDTRLYHEADKDYMIREYTSRESRMDALQVPPSMCTDPNAIWPHLPLIDSQSHKLQFPL